MLFSEAKRKTGKVHTVDSGSTMRKEVLKAAKSRHKSAGRATEGNNNSSERTNSEEEFAEVFSDTTTAAGMLCFYNVFSLFHEFGGSSNLGFSFYQPRLVRLYFVIIIFFRGDIYKF